MGSSGDGKSARRVTIDVAERDDGERLDKLLAARIADLSRTRVQSLIRGGHVRTSAVAVGDVGRLVKAGETYDVAIPPPEAAEPMPEAIALDIVYEDDEVIVIDKPAGLTVHPAPGHPTGTLVNALIAHCGASLSGIGGVRRPGIVHRLDKDTTGLMVVAKTDRAHKSLSEQFASHGADGRLVRGYKAIVWGVPERLRGVIDAPLGRSAHNRTRMAVVPSAAGRRAVTHYEVLETYGYPGEKAVASQLALQLETGRTHQVRVHLAHLGHPLLGDKTYGAGFKASERRLPVSVQETLAMLDRQALHAAVLEFEHPKRKRRLSFRSEGPADFLRLANDLAGLALAQRGPA